MTDQAVQKVADAIFQAHATGTPCAPVRELLPEGKLDLAYAAQEINTKRWLDAGRRLVGRKIGLTSLAVQKQLGVDQPDYGMLFDDMAVPDGWEIGRKQLIQPKVEAEVAFVLERDLDQERITLMRSWSRSRSSTKATSASTFGWISCWARSPNRRARPCRRTACHSRAVRGRPSCF